MFSDFLLGSQSILILQIPADILYIHRYIRYVVDIVLLCECTDLLHSFCVRGVAAPGHLGSIGWEPQTVSGHLGHARCCARAQDTGRAQKALNFSNAVMEAAAPPVPLHVLVHFVFTFLRDAVFPPKNYS